MPRRTSYRAGVPCWIDCLSCDPTATQDFYRALFGWTFDPGPNTAGPAGGYRLIRCRGGNNRGRRRVHALFLHWRLAPTV